MTTVGCFTGVSPFRVAVAKSAPARARAKCFLMGEKVSRPGEPLGGEEEEGRGDRLDRQRQEERRPEVAREHAEPPDRVGAEREAENRRVEGEDRGGGGSQQIGRGAWRERG